MKRKVRVLVVDDSAMSRRILSEGLKKDPSIEVVGSAADAYIARDKIVELRPDVITLDMQMPRMDGLSFLRKLMPQFPLPVVMVSAFEKENRMPFAAIEAGAVNFVAKPEAGFVNGLNEMMVELCSKVKLAAMVNVSHFKACGPDKLKPREKADTTVGAVDQIVVIGASAGGTEAIREVITRFPQTTSGVVIAQHMPAGFTRMFAERLNCLCSMTVKEAVDGDQVIPGVILVAPGSYHMTVMRSDGHYHVKCRKGEKVCGHCPSVDILMKSAASCAGSNAVGIMLTGMGHDGAAGLKAMRDAGARTIAQNRESCVVFGMPGAAIKAGGVEFVMHVEDIPGKVLNLLSETDPVAV